MTFSTIEKSANSARPVELLKLNYTMQSWNYTTAEVPISYNGEVYKPLQIKRGNLQPTGDSTKATMKISVPHDTLIGDLFRVRPPSEIVTLAIFAEHYLDNDFQILWKGRVVAVDWNTPWLDLHTESVFSSLKRVGLRRRYSSQCSHVLYGAKCGISREAMKFGTAVTAISGVSVTMDSINNGTDGFYAGGYMQWTNNSTGAIERQMIVWSSGTVMTMALVPVGLAAGSAIELFPGCDHSITTCSGTFNNALNFGGMPFIPSKNPFGGSTIY